MRTVATKPIVSFASSFIPAIIVILLLFITPVFIGTGLISLLTKILIYSLLAMSLDIAFGYTGLWSFSHAAIFGAAAYTAGILIRHYGITSFWVVAPSGIIMAVIVSAIFAWIGLRMSGIYFLLITLALGQLVSSVAFKWKEMTGGSDGLHNIPYPDLGIDFSPVSYYYFTLTIVIVCAVLMYVFIKSPFGKSLQGIRENETRMRTLGYNTWFHKFAAFVFSGIFAGVSGILYLHYNGVIVPDSVGMVASGLVMIMIIIGGTGTLWGGFIGSVVIFALGYYVSIFTPQRWPLVLGACLIAVVMLARGGIFPALKKIWMRMFGYGST